MRRRVFFFALILMLSSAIWWMRPQVASGSAKNPGWEELHSPAGNRPTHINPHGITVLPDGRLITPLGRQIMVAPHPYGLTLSPDGKILVTSDDGTWPFAVSIISQPASMKPGVAQIPPGYPPIGSDTNPHSVYLGVAIAPDNQTLYVSEGDNGRVGVFNLLTRRSLYSFSLNGTFEGKTYHHSLVGDLKISPDGHYLYINDIAHFRLVVFDTRARKIVASIRVGRLPFALAVSPNGKHVYVTNIGMFRYSAIPGSKLGGAKDIGIPFPAFGFPSPQADHGVVAYGRRIPGLGSPNLPQSDSVYVVDVVNPRHPKVTAKVRTGLPVGPESVGGSSPGGIAVDQSKIFVSNTAQDSITIIDTRTNRVEKTVRLSPAETVRGLLGVLPFGLALSPDGSRLYVACSGINAVAVMDTRSDTILGYFPAGWFPARVAVSPNGKTLYVENAKGYGAGPNGGPEFHAGPAGDYIGNITRGMVSVIPTPGADALPRLTKRVLANNGFLPHIAAMNRSVNFPIPPPGHPSQKIKYVVLIVKENRTFDDDFGDLRSVDGEKVNGLPSLARYGDDATVRSRGEPTVYHARVTPNEHALAKRFGISDNYFVDSDVSVDGHHWLVNCYPTEFIESEWPMDYGHRMHFLADNNTPGRMVGDSLSPPPEDYPQDGTLWNHLARHHITFRNYGEGFAFTAAKDGPGLEPTGTRETVNIPMQKVLFRNTSRHYPMFNTSIPDQYRYAQFKKSFEKRYVSGKEPLPHFLYICLPNDHTAPPRPADGYPYRASYVADNDLALGKMIQLFSHSRFWKHMAIFVTEDDAQDGTDHVDAHRSLLLVISPYSRRGVCHLHIDMESILKTVDLIFGLPPLNQFDATANSLANNFTDKPDFKPYTALPPDGRIFNPAKVHDPGYYARIGQPLPPSVPMDNPSIIERQMYRQYKAHMKKQHGD